MIIYFIKQVHVNKTIYNCFTKITINNKKLKKAFLSFFLSPSLPPRPLSPRFSDRTLKESERRSPPYLMTASNSKTSGWRWNQFRGLARSLLTALITWVPNACLTRHGSYSACLEQHVLRALPECTAKAAKPEVNSHWSCHGVEVM